MSFGHPDRSKGVSTSWQRRCRNQLLLTVQNYNAVCF